MRRSKAPSAIAKKKVDDPATSNFTPPVKKPATATVAAAGPIKREPLTNVSNVVTSTKEQDDTATTSHREEEGPVAEKPASASQVPITKPSTSKGGVGFKTPFKSPTTATNAAIIKAKQQQEKDAANGLAEPDIYFTVMWCNYSNKKHKTYNDGKFTHKGTLI